MEYTVAVADSNGTVIWSEEFNDGEVENLLLPDILREAWLDSPYIFLGE